MCVAPMVMYWGKTINPETQCRVTTFKSCESLSPEYWFFAPCGKCIDCLLKRASEWALRATKEAKMHEQNAFITISYMDSWLKGRHTLRYADIQKLWKRLRKEGHKIRYLACSEYGPITLRPHYHAITFGYYPEDCYPWKQENGRTYYRSESLEKLWDNKGEIIIAPAQGGTMDYIAKYHTKLNGLNVDPSFWDNREPMKLFMSRMPAIGIPWLEKYSQQVYVHNAVEHNGYLKPIPRAFNEWFKKNIPWEWREMTRKRMRLMWRKYQDKPEEFQVNRLAQKHGYLTDLVNQNKKFKQ